MLSVFTNSMRWMLILSSRCRHSVNDLLLLLIITWSKSRIVKRALVSTAPYWWSSTWMINDGLLFAWWGPFHCSQSPVLELSGQGDLIGGLAEPAPWLPFTQPTGQASPWLGSSLLFRPVGCLLDLSLPPWLSDFTERSADRFAEEVYYHNSAKGFP